MTALNTNSGSFRAIYCPTCKHKMSKHSRYCNVKTCLCGLSIDDFSNPFIVEQERRKLDARRIHHKPRSGNSIPYLRRELDDNDEKPDFEIEK